MRRRFFQKRILTGDCLVALAHNPGDFFGVLGQCVELFKLKPRVNAEKYLQGSRHFFKRSIPRPIAQSVDRHFTPIGATLDRSQGIRRRQAKVIMTVDRERRAIANLLFQLLDEVLDRCWKNTAAAIVYVEMAGARLGCFAICLLYTSPSPRDS